MFTCPVCGYSELKRPAEEFLICPSCGTEFGYDDYATPWSDLREQWRIEGYPWFSNYYQPPPNWNPVSQLMRAGLAPGLQAGLTATDSIAPVQEMGYRIVETAGRVTPQFALGGACSVACVRQPERGSVTAGCWPSLMVWVSRGVTSVWRVSNSRMRNGLQQLFQRCALK